MRSANLRQTIGRPAVTRRRVIHVAGSGAAIAAAACAGQGTGTGGLRPLKAPVTIE
jgi:hypothetical protein